MERPEGAGLCMGGGTESPSGCTLFSQDVLLPSAESYLAEIAETYFTEAYMSQINKEKQRKDRALCGKRRYQSSLPGRRISLEASSPIQQTPISPVYFHVFPWQKVLKPAGRGELHIQYQLFVGSGGRRRWKTPR